ncbi:MAG: hypothetical protein PWQ82_1160 [Thermosediminibacterales bacterium]|nr:hypothetical protein [Thermosediminibacterales bacterium]
MSVVIAVGKRIDGIWNVKSIEDIRRQNNVNLDRFAQGLKDTQSGEPELAGHCKHCDQPIYIDEEHVIFEDEVFCDVYCFARYMGAEEVN